jgi:hypothetical protein
MDGELRVYLSEDGADDEHLDVLTGHLRRELLELDIDDATALRAGQPPPGARAFDVAVVGGLVVTLGQSAEALRQVASMIRAWLRRGDGAGRMVRLELGGDAIELSNASVGDQAKLIDLFVARHTMG